MWDAKRHGGAAVAAEGPAPQRATHGAGRAPGRRGHARAGTARHPLATCPLANGTNPFLAAEFVALRVTPAANWRRAERLEPGWLRCERPLGGRTATKYYLSDLPPDTLLTHLVRLAHTRWAIEQHYQDFKTELGLDHFEGRSDPGWHHHMVISAVAYAFLQAERLRRGSAAPLTFPAMGAIVQEVFTGLLFAARPIYVRWINQAQRNFPLRT